MYSVQNHHFIGGVYAKEVIIKDGHEVAQHVHEFDHMSILAKGCAVVFQGDKCETYYAPAIIEIKAGVQHSVVAVNGDITWYCIHKTDETDETKVDNVLIKKAQMFDTGLKIDVAELNQAIAENPQLWNQYTLRTESTASPHYGCDDIWIRFNAIENLDLNNPKSMHDKHESVWYVNQLTMIVSDIAREIMKNIPKDSELGGILITRIPVGSRVLPHSDAGRWHAEYYQDKYLIPLKSNDKQAFCYDKERHITQVGHVYKFNNLVPHWVDNDSDEERISLIICTKHKT